MGENNEFFSNHVAISFLPHLSVSICIIVVAKSFSCSISINEMPFNLRNNIEDTIAVRLFRL